MLFFPSKPNPYLEDPDVVLMMSFKEGDQKAFDAILDRNYQKVFAFICRMIGDEASGEDLTQDVFMKLYGMKAAYQARSKLTTLLFQIARNASLNYLRSHKTHVSLDQEIQGEGSHLKQQVEDIKQTSVQQELEKEELAKQIQLAIEALPENQRTAILLQRFEDMSYEEIAATMQMSPQAVKSLLNRAKENLKVSLKHYF